MRPLLHGAAASRLPPRTLWQRLPGSCRPKAGLLLPLLVLLLLPLRVAVHVHRGSCSLRLPLLLPLTGGIAGRMLPPCFLLLCTPRAPRGLAQQGQLAARTGSAAAAGVQSDAVLLVQSQVAVAHQQQVNRAQGQP